MAFLGSLRRLWRHRYLRRLLAVRVATHTGDGVLQIALASYVLFSPERQPDAASVAGALAITLLPFSILGPFVAVVIDRASRRQIIVAVEAGRATLVLALAALVATGAAGRGTDALFYAGVLAAMSLNRFLLAALSAGLPHTVEPSEYLVASAVVPTLGPVGALIGAILATTTRLLTGTILTDYQANAVLFGLAAVGFGTAGALALRIPRPQLGPHTRRTTTARDILSGLFAALGHLARRREAGLGLLTIGASRIIFGTFLVATVLAYRNYFHPVDEINAGIADLGLLVVSTGAGLVLAAVVTPPATALMGVRAWMALCLLASAAFQLVPGALYVRPWPIVAAFLLGVCAQSLKVCVDTVVQAHVADEYRGRAFVIYDMVFNVALVSAAALTALLLPPNGKSTVALAALAACYVLLGLAFLVASRGLNLDAGTQSLRGDLRART